jgi:chorismate mutase/prephenate dehydrogenase
MQHPTIQSLRQDIDDINQEIIELIAKRVEVAKSIGDKKASHDEPIHQPDREKEVLRSCRKKAEESGLDPDTINDVFKAVIRMCRKKQKN